MFLLLLQFTLSCAKQTKTSRVHCGPDAWSTKCWKTVVVVYPKSDCSRFSGKKLVSHTACCWSFSHTASISHFYLQTIHRWASTLAPSPLWTHARVVSSQRLLQISRMQTTTTTFSRPEIHVTQEINIGHHHQKISSCLPKGCLKQLNTAMLTPPRWVIDPIVVSRKFGLSIPLWATVQIWWCDMADSMEEDYVDLMGLFYAYKDTTIVKT